MSGCSVNISHEWECIGTELKECPFCSKSQGERIVSKILTNLGIHYIPEYRHPLISHKRYDFYFQHNDGNYLIEYDGMQHFQDVPFFNKKTTFEKRHILPSIHNIYLFVYLTIITSHYRRTQVK